MSAAEEYQLNPYLGWQKEQGIPIHMGFFVEDLRKVRLGFWKARNANGAFINLSNAVVNDAVVLEVPPGEKTLPRRQLFDESVMVVEGQGATSMWYEDGRKKTFEWQQGSVFAIPPNVWHEHYAMSAPARLVSCTSAPLYMQLFNNNDFLFNCDYKFLDRYAEQENYFVESPKLLPGFKGIETNFIADVRQWFTRETVDALEAKGGFRQSRDRAHDAFSMRIRFAKTMMFLHLSGWSVGTYKKAHRHGPGFNIVILDGEGFSFMWEEGKQRERIDWHEWSMFVPPAMWFHEHFNTSVRPVRFLAFHPPGMLAYPGWSGEGEHFIGKGPNQIEYDDEDPDIRKMFEYELAKNGLVSRMPKEIYENRKAS
jgi:quercetin dioxygenase-like cupin family protein